VTDAWSERAELYRTSAAHSEGADLDLIVEWAAGARTALDVATGGGHVARRLREAGLEVVTVDPATGMRPDVIAVAENLPFADSSFDLSATRVAAHHFGDVRAAVRELARVAADRVLIVDNLNLGDEIERAEKIRDPSHVRNYHEAEWRSFAADAGLTVDEVRVLEHPVELEPWLERTDCTGEDAAVVRGLLAPRLRDGWILFERLALRASKPREPGA
jgi:SAM-dependent methyltransferase